MRGVRIEFLTVTYLDNRQPIQVDTDRLGGNTCIADEGEDGTHSHNTLGIIDFYSTKWMLYSQSPWALCAPPDPKVHAPACLLWTDDGSKGLPARFVAQQTATGMPSAAHLRNPQIYNSGTHLFFAKSDASNWKSGVVDVNLVWIMSGFSCQSSMLTHICHRVS